ncbi:MAG TPA: prepilin peptidase [Nautiliaceae bacterium]|nr:prepilin peptidase [Nautiliaceae bacterium]
MDFILLPIEVIKFSLALFFLLLFSYYDVVEGRIPNKILIFMLIFGILFLFFEKEFLKSILITLISVFLFSYLLWEFSLLTPGDVKLLTILTFYLPYSTGINPYSSLAVIMIFVLFVYSFFVIFRRFNKKIIKKSLKEYINYLKKLDYLALLLFLFLIIQIFNILNLSTLQILLVAFLLVFLIDNITKKLEIKGNILLIIMNLVLLYYQYNFRSLDLKSILLQLVFAFLFFITVRTLFIILFFYISTKEKRIEELKIGDKLILLPVKIGKNDFVYPLNYNMLIPKHIKENLLFNYNPNLGLESSNISKIKRFLKRKGLLKVKIIEELPFVPFLLISFLIFYLYYFYTYFF